MKQKIKDFFTQKRCKKLLNNKGFSLLEVLVAVSIIGIISAIAIPQYNKNKNEAAKVAGSTTISNIRKAHQNCLVLKDFGDCDTLGEIGISCADCESTHDADTFCADFKKGSGSNEMKACVSIKGDNTVITYGGDLMEGSYICQSSEYQSANTPKWGAWSDVTPVKNCKTSTATTDCGVASVSAPNNGDKKYQCTQVNKQGECNSSHECT